MFCFVFFIDIILTWKNIGYHVIMKMVLELFYDENELEIVLIQKYRDNENTMDAIFL